MSVAAFGLLALAAALLAFDAVALRGRNPRALLLEAAAFGVGGWFIVFPAHATWLAHATGIGRGVDFLLYPVVIWLARESLIARRRRLEDAERITELVRALAVTTARPIDAVTRATTAAPDGADHRTPAAPIERNPAGQSAGSSAAATT